MNMTINDFYIQYAQMLANVKNEFREGKLNRSEYMTKVQVYEEEILRDIFDTSLGSDLSDEDYEVRAKALGVERKGV